jgi:hypothetical protein
MPLKRHVANLEEVEEKDRGYYVKNGEGFALDLDGDDDSTSLSRALEHERKQRTEAIKRAQALEEKFKDIDPDKYKASQERLATLEDQRLKDEGKYAELAERKYEQAKAAIEAEKATLTTQLQREKDERAKIEMDRASLIIEQGLRSTLLDLGADPQGIKYAVSLHRPKWTLGDDGRTPVQLGEDGKPRSGIKDPHALLTMTEDLSDWQQKDKFAEKFFLPSTGGGARGGVGGANGGAVILTRADARDVYKYEAAKAQAEKSGVPLQVSE